MLSRSALTLLELITVLCILAALSGLLIPLSHDQASSASQTATNATLREVELAFQQYWKDTKSIVLDGTSTYAVEADRFKVSWLFKNPVTNDQTNQFDPNSRQGWNGPYILLSTSNGISQEIVDAWNTLLDVQYVNPSANLKDVRVVSAGPNKTIDISSAAASSTLTNSSIGDDIYVAFMLR